MALVFMKLFMRDGFYLFDFFNFQKKKTDEDKINFQNNLGYHFIIVIICE